MKRTLQNSGEHTRLACCVARPRAMLLKQNSFHFLFGEAPKSAREGACAPQHHKIAPV